MINQIKNNTIFDTLNKMSIYWKTIINNSHFFFFFTVLIVKLLDYYCHTDIFNRDSNKTCIINYFYE